MKPIAITIIVIGFLFLLKFQFPHYQISSDNMKPKLLNGDIILVSKLSKNDIVINDICVFEFNETQKLSRVVGLSGDKLEIINSVLFINDVGQSEVLTAFTYRVLLANHPPLAEYDLMLLLQPLNQFEEYKAVLTENQVKEMARYEFVKSITQIIHPKNYHYSFSEHPIFSNKNSFNWSRDNLGPITIPEKCYFVMGDNRSQSLDSRYFGFVKEDDIIGKMMATIYSPNE